MTSIVPSLLTAPIERAIDLPSLLIWLASGAIAVGIGGILVTIARRRATPMVPMRLSAEHDEASESSPSAQSAA